MEAARNAPPWFTRGDIDGFFGLALDNLVQLLLIDGLCRTVIGMSPALLYGRVLPGAALVRAKRCRTSALIKLDLPTFERPTNAISGNPSRGKPAGDAALVTNSAVTLTEARGWGFEAGAGALFGACFPSP